MPINPFRYTEIVLDAPKEVLLRRLHAAVGTVENPQGETVWQRYQEQVRSASKAKFLGGGRGDTFLILCRLP